jgi:lipoic acid synthetase
VAKLHELQPDLLVETLVGDFGGRSHDVRAMIDSEPDVFAHNIEVPRRITPFIRDQRCDYDLSLRVLREAKERAPDRFTKSSIMVGMGETDEEVFETMRDLKENRVDIVTLGQYLRPTPKHAAVARFVTPEMFGSYKAYGDKLGFQFVASGALVRSSYHAAEGFIAARIREGKSAIPQRAERASGLKSAVAAVRPPAMAPAPPLEQLIAPGSLVRNL